METKRKHAAHLCNLIAMALRDNDFDEKEKKVIMKIATRLGICYDDFREIIQNDSLVCDIPEALSERIQHLHDMVLVMMADGVVHEEEVKFIARFINIYGFNIIKDDQKINVNIEELRNQRSFEKFMIDFKKISDKEISSVVVDLNYNITFPLYEKRLENLGPLPKALYIYFLMNKEPISIIELGSEENKEKLRAIYAILPNSEFNTKEKIDNLTHPLGYSFNCNRTLIKKSIKQVIPTDNLELIDNYLISGSRNQKKFIALSKDMIHIQPKILK